jgi:hypothetical protein
VHSINLSKFALNSELTTAIGTLEAADAALEAKINKVIEDAYDDTEIRGLITKEVSDREAADLVLDGKIATAQGAAEKAQKEVDDLEGVVEELSGTVSSEVARVEGLVSAEATARGNAISGINTKIGSVEEGKTVVGLIGEAQAAAEGKVTTLENGTVKSNTDRIKAIEDDYLTSEDQGTLEAAIAANTTKIGADITTAKNELTGAATDASSAATIFGAKKYAEEKAGDVQTNLTNHINAYNTKVQELVDEDSRIAGLVATEVQDRTSEISRVAGLVTEEENRAKGIETSLQTQITELKNNTASGLHFRGIKNALTDVENPQSGDICIVGTQEYIYDGSDWEEFGNAEAHATKTELNNGLALKVNVEDYDSKVAELVAEDADIRVDFAAADASLKSELEGKINGKVAQGDFNTLSETVTGLGTSKLDKSTYESHITVYNDHLEAQSAIDAAQTKDITDIKTSLSTGAIHTEIDGVRTLAQQGVNDAAAVDGRVTTLSGTVEGISTELAGVKATAEAAAVKDTVDAAIAAINADLAKKALDSDLDALTTRVGTAEGKITTAEGNITTLQGKVTALEGTYTNAQVDKVVSDAVNVEKTRAEAAESALSNRIDAYDTRFGTKDDILVFDCGSSTTVI